MGIAPVRVLPADRLPGAFIDGWASPGRASATAARRRPLGVVVGQEVTLSRRNGWHYHGHLVVPVDGPTDEEAEAAGNDRDALEALVRARAKAAGEAVAERYKAALRAAGGKVSDEHGTYVRVAEDGQDAADYSAKGSMAWEVAGGATKDETRATGSLTPWDLANLAYDGDGWARARWAEYADVMLGTRSCVVSPALAARLGITPADDAEECNDVLGQLLFVVPAARDAALRGAMLPQCATYPALRHALWQN